MLRSCAQQDHAFDFDGELLVFHSCARRPHRRTPRTSGHTVTFHWAALRHRYRNEQRLLVTSCPVSGCVATVRLTTQPGARKRMVTAARSGLSSSRERFALARGGGELVHMRLNRALRHALRNHDRVALEVRIDMKDAAGTTRSESATYRLRLQRHHRRHHHHRR